MRYAGLMLVVVATACSSKSPSGNDGKCSTNTQCNPGFICLEGSCRALCTTDADCGGGNDCKTGKICTTGVCEAGCRADAPTITSIDGDGTADTGPADSHGTVTPHHIHSGFQITGTHLSGASAVLIDGNSQSIPLHVTQSTDTLLAAVAPATPTIALGLYTLQVTNAVGSDQTQVYVARGEQGPSGPAGPPPSAAAIQAAVSAMTNLDVPSLAGRPAAGYQTTAQWGRFYEAESAPLSTDVTVGQTAPDTTASGGSARVALFGSTTSGKAFGFTSDDLGEPIAPGRARLDLRLKVTTNTLATAVADISCAAIRGSDNTSTWVDVGARSLAPSDFAAADAWQSFSLECNFLPDDADQAIWITFHNNITDLHIDTLRLTPVAGNLLTNGVLREPNVPAFAIFDNSGGDQTTNGMWPGDQVIINNGGYYDTTNHYFKAPVAGLYSFSWICLSNTNLTNPTGRTFVYKNGVSVFNSNGDGRAISILLDLKAGDTVNLGGSSTYVMAWYGARAHNLFSGYLVAAE